MEQLSGADNVSLFAERGNTYNHVGTLVIYDVTTAPSGKVRYKDILRHFEERLYLHPVFRRHLAQVPFGLDRPYWVDATEIDVEYHIRHIALPKPGDWRQLMIQVARLHSLPLDRRHPLWEAYVIEGLDNIPNLPPGAFAIFLKIHHAAVDGMAAIHLLRELHTSTPEQDPAFHKPKAIVGDSEPSAVELLSRSLSNNLSRTGKLLRMASAGAGHLLHSGKDGLQLLSEGKLAELPARFKQLFPPPAPATRFSAKVSPHRVIEGFGMPISRIKRIRDKVPGVTLNDVFIAVAGGAVRKYLLGKGELPRPSLCGLMPISLRTDASAGGNEVAGIPVQVCSNIEDPLERLKAIHSETRISKEKAQKLGLDALKNLFDVLPPFIASPLLDRVLLPRINLAVSNVRGPDQAMYLAGAKAMCLYPVSIPADGSGLNFTAVSYNRVVWLSMVSCRRMVPDPGVLLACMREAWEELLAAADALPEPTPHSGKATRKPATPRKPASRGKPRNTPQA